MIELTTGTTVTVTWAGSGGAHFTVTGTLAAVDGRYLTIRTDRDIEIARVDILALAVTS